MDPHLLSSDLGDPFSVVAMFGFELAHLHSPQLFKITRRLIENAGLQGNVLSSRKPGRPSGGYKPATARSIHILESENMRSFSLHFVAPPETDPAKFGLLGGQTMGESIVFSGRTNYLPPDGKATTSIVAEVAQVYPTIYGYQYVIDRTFGPVFHAVGIFYHKFDQKSLAKLSSVEGRRTSSWFNKDKDAISRGVLRDVFPLNLFSEVHRRLSIDGIPLFDWINQDESRGRLEQITRTLWAWHVPESRCIELGDLFESAGLLASSPKPQSAEQNLQSLEEFLKSSKLIGPETLVLRPGDKHGVEVQSPEGRARINNSIEKLKTREKKKTKEE